MIIMIILYVLKIFLKQAIIYFYQVRENKNAKNNISERIILKENKIKLKFVLVLLINSQTFF